jgi:hypothetical protein
MCAKPGIAKKARGDDIRLIILRGLGHFRRLVHRQLILLM